MVYPVGAQQQIPAANTFQPGTVDPSKRPEDNKNPDSTKASGSEAGRTSSAETRNNGRVESTREYDSARSTERSSDNGSVSASSARGTNLNITV